MNPRFDGGILDFMDGIPDFIKKNSKHFNMVHRKVHWQNPKLKSLDSMPGLLDLRAATRA